MPPLSLPRGAPTPGLPLRVAGAFEVCEVGAGWGGAPARLCEFPALLGLAQVYRFLPWSWDPGHTAGISKSNSQRSGRDGSPWVYRERSGGPLCVLGSEVDACCLGTRVQGTQYKLYLLNKPCVHLSLGAA